MNLEALRAAVARLDDDVATIKELLRQAQPPPEPPTTEPAPPIRSPVRVLLDGPKGLGNKRSLTRSDIRAAFYPVSKAAPQGFWTNPRTAGSPGACGKRGSK